MNQNPVKQRKSSIKKTLPRGISSDHVDIKINVYTQFFDFPVLTRNTESKLNNEKLKTSNDIQMVSKYLEILSKKTVKFKNEDYFKDADQSINYLDNKKLQNDYASNEKNEGGMSAKWKKVKNIVNTIQKFKEYQTVVLEGNNDIDKDLDIYEKTKLPNSPIIQRKNKKKQEDENLILNQMNSRKSSGSKSIKNQSNSLYMLSRLNYLDNSQYSFNNQDSERFEMNKIGLSDRIKDLIQLYVFNLVVVKMQLLKSNSHSKFLKSN